ncbi:hypothetical protein [Sphaerotilus montanus]|uniref:hypothetical protein n=1 Tax=Sphaerotilus montanus TaxID=522889 RepID=UPI003FA21532
MNHPPRRSRSVDRPPLESKRLLDQLRERTRIHGVRHPKDMGAAHDSAPNSFRADHGGSRCPAVQTEGETGLLARLLYGTGMCLLEGLRLRVTDLDIPREITIVSVRAWIPAFAGMTK